MINYSVIEPLEKKEIQFDDWYKDEHPSRIAVIERVMFLNPKKLYEKVEHKINTHNRHQKLQMEDVFPKVLGKCACGCRKKPVHGKNQDSSQWSRKWASNDCNAFALDVLSIMNNYFGKPAFYVSLYYGKKCIDCDGANYLELDHIIGVKHGGGACWLSNYVWRCKDCHVKKTNKDFNRKDFKNPNQLKLI